MNDKTAVISMLLNKLIALMVIGLLFIGGALAITQGEFGPRRTPIQPIHPVQPAAPIDAKTLASIEEIRKGVEKLILMHERGKGTVGTAGVGSGMGNATQEVGPPQ